MRKHLESRARLPMVRPLHYLLLMSIAYASGCVIPLPYEEADSSQELNAQPVIVAANPRMPGPVVLNEQALETPFTVDLSDADLGDTLYVRTFRNYQNGPTPFFNNTSVTNDPIGGDLVRTVTLDVTNWCNDATLGADLVFDVLVSDRPFDPDLSLPPAFQAVEEGAKTDRESWVINCIMQ